MWFATITKCLSFCPFLASRPIRTCEAPKWEANTRPGFLSSPNICHEGEKKKTLFPPSISHSFSATWTWGWKGCVVAAAWRRAAVGGHLQGNRYSPHTWAWESLCTPAPHPPPRALLYLYIMRSLPGSHSNFIQALIFLEEKKNSIQKGLWCQLSQTCCCWRIIQGQARTGKKKKSFQRGFRQSRALLWWYCQCMRRSVQRWGRKITTSRRLGRVQD